MTSKINIIKSTERRPISWSAISSFEWNPQDWYDKYIMGVWSKPTPAMLFGSTVGKKIETDPTYLPHVPRHSKMEYPFRVKYKKIHCIGFADSFCETTNRKLIEIKTGKSWDQKKVDEHGQITMYCLMNYLQNKIKPEDVEIKLIWLPTTDEPAFVEPIEETTQIFETKRTMVQVLKFASRLEDVVAKMQKFCDSRKPALGKALKGRSKIKKS